jgi:transposase
LSGKEEIDQTVHPIARSLRGWTAVWDATVFSKNRDRLLEAEVVKEFLALVVEQAREQGWASDEHFTVDGSLISCASAGTFG